MSTPAWFKKLFQKSKSSKSLLLIYFEDVLVGTLQFKNGKYIFTYDKGCPESLKIKGIESKELRTSHLPPFFTTRLPSKTRPEINAELKRLGSDDPILILGELSAKSPISPYKFKLKTG